MSNVTLDRSLADELTVSGCDHVFASTGGTLTLAGVSVQGGSVAGVYTYRGTLAVQNATLSGNGYGVAADESTVTIDDSILTGNSIGLLPSCRDNKSPLTVLLAALESSAWV